LAEQKLRESEKRFRDLANSMPQLVWTANPDGTVDYYNEKYRILAGYLQAGWGMEMGACNTRG
jgi:PAS domain S-box-containing protein